VAVVRTIAALGLTWRSIGAIAVVRMMVRVPVSVPMSMSMVMVVTMTTAMGGVRTRAVSVSRE